MKKILQKFSSKKGREKDLAEGEKVLIINEIAKCKTTKSISERIDPHMVTKIEDSDMIFQKSFKKETLV